MKRKTTVILAALGAVPTAALAQNVPGQTQEALALNGRTISVVQSLIASDALYANPEATELRIRSAVLSDEMISGLEQSSQVVRDDESGDYVVNSKFAAALAGSRILHQSSPKSVADVLLLLKLEKDLKAEPKIELASFTSAPFF